jgi:hypothetical protein
LNALRAPQTRLTGAGYSARGGSFWELANARGRPTSRINARNDRAGSRSSSRVSVVDRIEDRRNKNYKTQNNFSSNPVNE